MNHAHPIILPPANIGILGGGQLGAMLCEAGRRMGYHMLVLSESSGDPAATWASAHITGDTSDPATVISFAKNLAVLTNEFEQVPPEVLEAAERLNTCRVAPSSAVQRTCRDRRHEKNLFATFHFPHGPFAIVESQPQLVPAYQKLAGEKNIPVVAKTARGGYDGKGQLWLRSPQDVATAWDSLGQIPLMLEQSVPFIAEASVIVARAPSGQKTSFPMFKNHHKNGILFQTITPAGFSPRTEQIARAAAAGIADQLQSVGLLAVEMFVLENGDVLINELAARPHNSGHLTLRATARSQFELHIAAICNLPLAGPVVPLLQPAVMTNLLGDLWRNGQPDWSALFELPTGTLHLYGKEPRPSRKMGHLIHTAPTPEQALADANAAYQSLTPTP